MANLGIMASLTNMTFLLEASGESSSDSFILSFSLSTLLQIGFQALAVLILIAFLAKLLFNPIRESLKKREESIASTYNEIETNQREAAELKKDYEDKLRNIKAEGDKILSHAHAKAVAREDEIVKQAQDEANRILQRAQLEIQRERDQMKDEVKKQIIDVATVMAAKFVEASLSEDKQRALIQQTLSEMGDDTWTN